jgi:hypothetical protein
MALILSLTLLLVAWVLTTLFFHRAWSRAKSAKPFDRLAKIYLGLVCAALALAAAFIAFAGTQAPVPAAATASSEPPMETFTCQITAFPEGGHAVPADSGRVGCIVDLIERLRRQMPERLLLTGHVDHRELRPGAVKVYGSNLSLATQRATAVKDWLSRELSQSTLRSTGQRFDFERIVTLMPSGALHIGAGVTNADRESDRRVDIRVVWRAVAPPRDDPSPRPWWEKVGRQLNTSALDSSSSLAFLAFLVALSAYLATVRLFLKQPTTTTSGATVSASKKLALVLITVADLPMILAALLLGLHIFAFAPPAFLRLSFLLFVFAGGTMVILHAREWVLSWSQVVK